MPILDPPRSLNGQAIGGQRIPGEKTADLVLRRLAVKARLQFLGYRYVELIEHLHAQTSGPGVPQECHPLFGERLLFAFGTVPSVDEQIRVSEGGPGHGAPDAKGTARTS